MIGFARVVGYHSSMFDPMGDAEKAQEVLFPDEHPQEEEYLFSLSIINIW